MPSNTKHTRTPYILLFCIVLAGICMTIFMIGSKKGMHVDEYYSYGLSNYTGAEIYMSIEPGETYDNPEEPFQNYMTVHPDNRFSYKNVWDKQSADVHPPFYYVLLHTICSFFPGEFSIWFAAVINILFFAGIILLTYAVMKRLTQRDTPALLASLLCALSGGIIQINTFLRMYTMLMFLILLLTWLHVKYYNKQTVCFFLMYPFTILAGILTHYYFLIFLVMQGLYFGISLLLRKRWKNACIYLGQTIISMGISFAIFPAMTEHIFSGYRGQESLDNLASSSGYVTGLYEFMKIISKNLTGNMLYIIGVVFAGLLLYQLVTKHMLQQIPYQGWCMLLVSAGGFYFLISKIAVYRYDRYISPVYPVLILLIAGIIDYSMQSLFKTRKLRLAAACLLTLTCLLPSYFQCDWIYLQRPTGNAVSAAKEHYNLNCIVINSGINFWNHTLYFEAKNYQSVTFLSDVENLKYTDTQVFYAKPVVVYIMNVIENQDAILQEMIQQNPSYSQYIYLPGSVYSQGYLLK